MSNLDKLNANHVLILRTRTQLYNLTPLGSNLYRVTNISYGFNTLHGYTCTKADILIKFNSLF